MLTVVLVVVELVYPLPAGCVCAFEVCPLCCRCLRRPRPPTKSTPPEGCR